MDPDLQQQILMEMDLMIFILAVRLILPGKFLLQQTDGKFIVKNIPAVNSKDQRHPKIWGCYFLMQTMMVIIDLYCASGSDEFPANTNNYQDRFFVNDGKGNFSTDSISFAS